MLGFTVAQTRLGRCRRFPPDLVEKTYIAEHAGKSLDARWLSRAGYSSATRQNDRTMIGAVPGALVTRTSSSDEFQVTHRILRGTRPLHITAVPSGKIYWGEYFDNRERAEVHIYVSTDRGLTWQIAYTFPAGSIRHVHNIVYDRWGDCLWILTGDDGAECKVLRASCDLDRWDPRWMWCWQGNQQVRAVAAIPTPKRTVFFNRYAL